MIFSFTYLFIYLSIYSFVHSIIHWQLLDFFREYYRLYIFSSVYRNFRLKKSNEMQQSADIYLLLNYSTCYGRPSRPSSGVHKTVVAASGTDYTIWEQASSNVTTCRISSTYYRLVVVQFVTLIGWTYGKLTGVLAVCFKVDQLLGLILRTVKTSKESNQNYNLNFNQLNLKFQGVWVLYNPRITVSQNIRRFRWQDDTWKMKCNMLGGSIQEVNLNVYSGWHGVCALCR